jgi:hypothetical protein
MKIFPLAVGIMCLVLGVATAEQGKIMQESDKYLVLVENLLGDPPQSAGAVKEQIGVALRPFSKTAKLRDEGEGTGTDGLAFDSVMLTYLPSGKPGVLMLTLPPDHAPLRKDVTERFTGLTITATPRGRSLDEQTEFTRSESWGLLGFGFAERDPTKLRSIVFNYIPEN